MFVVLSLSQFWQYILTPEFQVVENELLKRDAFDEKLKDGPFESGFYFGITLWTVYSWVTRLRYGVLPQATIVSPFVLTLANRQTFPTILSYIPLFYYCLLFPFSCPSGRCSVTRENV